MFQNYGTVLSRDAMRKVLGGNAPGGDDGGSTPCTVDADCGNKVRSCSSGDLVVNGRCYSGSGGDRVCHWAGCPS